MRFIEQSLDAILFYQELQKQDLVYVLAQRKRLLTFHLEQTVKQELALLSTWMVGYAVNTLYGISYLKDRYSFVTVCSHGGYDYQCPSWIISPGFGAYNGEKTWFDYGLIGDYFEEAILVAKEECPEQTHRNMHWTFARSIDAMKDETAQQCLSAKLGYVFPIEQELHEDELVTRGLL